MKMKRRTEFKPVRATREHHKVTPDEMEFIKANAGVMTTRMMAYHLRVSEHCVEYTIRKYGLGTRKVWTQEEDRFLLETYNGRNCWYVAGKIGRTAAAVRQRYAVKKKELGL